MSDIELKTPSGIYKYINEKLYFIIDSLSVRSGDSTLAKEKQDAHSQLTEYQKDLEIQLSELKNNAEWNIFTIAFYGETGAGKSTIIETLRILLQEPKKIASQQAFRELEKQYNLSKENLQKLLLAIAHSEAQFDELAQRLHTTQQQCEQTYTQAVAAIAEADARSNERILQLRSQLQQHEQIYSGTLDAVTGLRACLVTLKKNASFWRKLLNLLRKLPEDIELEKAAEKSSVAKAMREEAASDLHAEELRAAQERLATEQQLSKVAKERDNAFAAIADQQAKEEQKRRGLLQQSQKLESQSTQLLAEMGAQADGAIIGDGRPDFTQKTQSYNLILDDKPFALLDVPGIEGKEGLVLSEIERAVQTAHAVFYVTNQAAQPQTGDRKRQGTLEKIKRHLGAQTEVWTIFNKKITNPRQSLSGRPLISDDEKESLTELDKKMREHLGHNYREVFPITANVAFLASTDHFSPDSKNAKNRDKIIGDFSSEELLEKSRIHAFLQMFSSQLLRDGEDKIIRANFNKAKEMLDHVSNTLTLYQGNFAELSEKLRQDGDGAKSQLVSSFKALKKRLESRGETLIEKFAGSVRKQMYSHIDDDISNDIFKSALKREINLQEKQLSENLPEVMDKEVVRFQKEIEEVVIRFEEQARELSAIYSKLNISQLGGNFKFNLDIDNGIKVGGLLLSIGTGIIATIASGGWILVIGLAASVLAAGKAIMGFFSSDYRKSQQRKSLDENLSKSTEELKKSLNETLKGAFQEIAQKIHKIENIIEDPSRHAATLEQILGEMVSQFNVLSRQIAIKGQL